MADTKREEKYRCKNRNIKSAKESNLTSIKLNCVLLAEAKILHRTPEG